MCFCIWLHKLNALPFEKVLFEGYLLNCPSAVGIYVGDPRPEILEYGVAFPQQGRVDIVQEYRFCVPDARFVLGFEQLCQNLEFVGIAVIFQRAIR